MEIIDTGRLTDGQKYDLARVVCDNMTCLARSEFDRCYFDNFKECPHYNSKPHKYSDEDIAIFRQIKKIQ